jgi:hypothetical protein
MAQVAGHYDLTSYGTKEKNVQTGHPMHTGNCVMQIGAPCRDAESLIGCSEPLVSPYAGDMELVWGRFHFSRGRF